MAVQVEVDLDLPGPQALLEVPDLVCIPRAAGQTATKLPRVAGSMSDTEAMGGVGQLCETSAHPASTLAFDHMSTCVWPLITRTPEFPDCLRKPNTSVARHSPIRPCTEATPVQVTKEFRAYTTSGSDVRPACPVCSRVSTRRGQRAYNKGKQEDEHAGGPSQKIRTDLRPISGQFLCTSPCEVPRPWTGSCPLWPSGRKRSFQETRRPCPPFRHFRALWAWQHHTSWRSRLWRGEQSRPGSTLYHNPRIPLGTTCFNPACLGHGRSRDMGEAGTGRGKDLQQPWMAHDCRQRAHWRRSANGRKTRWTTTGGKHTRDMCERPHSEGCKRPPWRTPASTSPWLHERT